MVEATLRCRSLESGVIRQGNVVVIYLSQQTALNCSTMICSSSLGVCWTFRYPLRSPEGLHSRHSQARLSLKM